MELSAIEAGVTDQRLERRRDRRDLCPSDSESEEKVSVDYDRVFALIVAVCEKRPSMSLGQTARHLQVHRHTVTTIIKEQTSLSWRTWRRRAVAARALRLLEERPMMSIKEVAAACELTTDGLRRLLIRECGRTPTDLRGSRCA